MLIPNLGPRRLSVKVVFRFETRRPPVKNRRAVYFCSVAFQSAQLGPRAYFSQTVDQSNQRLSCANSASTAGYSPARR